MIKLKTREEIELMRESAQLVSILQDIQREYNYLPREALELAPGCSLKVELSGMSRLAGEQGDLAGT